MAKIGQWQKHKDDVHVIKDGKKDKHTIYIALTPKIPRESWGMKKWSVALTYYDSPPSLMKGGFNTKEEARKAMIKHMRRHPNG